MDNKVLTLVAMTPEDRAIDCEVTSVSLPGLSGRFQVLVDHAPLIAALGDGEVIYETDDGQKSLKIRSGFVEVKDNRVSLCVEL